MPEPFCTVDWFRDGYRQVWFFLAAEADQTALCTAMSGALAHAQDPVALEAAVVRVAAGFGLRAELLLGPSQDDPLAQYARVSLRGVHQ